MGTSEAALTFKCHLLGREDLLAAHDLRVIVRGTKQRQRETDGMIKGLTEGRNQKKKKKKRREEMDSRREGETNNRKRVKFMKSLSLSDVNALLFFVDTDTETPK